MNDAVTQVVGGVCRASSRVKSWLTPLLPNEPRILSSDTQAALTARYLLPVLPELEACLLAVRRQLDPELDYRQPVKLGKPYPLGQCLEIAEAVQKRLRSVVKESLSPDAAIGLGDLRGQYFQNAFQVGSLYVDVANDTVISTKPKVEILSFDQAQFIPIRSHRHFSQIAHSYWQHEIFPNHVLPALAPHCPLIHIDQSGQLHLHEATQYMLAMTRAQAFVLSEDVLRDAPMPAALFERLRNALRGAGFKVPRSAEDGRQQALQHCHQFRAKRWHRDPKLVAQVIKQAQLINLHLARSHHENPDFQHPIQDKQMPTIKIDSIDYDLDSLSAEAKAQLQSIQFVDQELAKLQMQVAAMQTARNAYVNALRAALPVVPGGAINLP